MNKLSIIIPSRSPQYLRKTIEDLLAKAEGEVEIIVIFDGRWPEPEEMPEDDKRVILIHQGAVHDSHGMRAAINKGMNLAKGEYVMKIDEHCMLDQGYDTKLKADCEENWMVVPRRKRLDADKWELVEDGRPDIDYMYVQYPYLKPYNKAGGLHGVIWNRPDRKDILIDDNPTMQGSFYFAKKAYWDKLFPNGMDDENYGPFTQEAQEVSMSVWLSGGRFIVNKKTWYAHFHKGSKGKGYGFSNAQYKKHCGWNEKGRLYCTGHWLTTKEYQHDFKWFVNEKFPEMPSWPEGWEEQIIEDRKKDFSTLGYKDDFWLSELKKGKL